MEDEIIKIFTYKAKFSNSERLEFAAYKRRKPKGKKGITNVELRLISRKLTGELKNQIRRLNLGRAEGSGRFSQSLNV